MILTATLISLAVQVFVIPVAGHLSDRFGRGRVYVIGALALAALMMVFFPLISSGSTALIILAYLIPYGVAYSFPQAIYQALFIEGRGALKRELVACLRTGRALREPRTRSRNKPQGHVTADVVISRRPAEADDRAVPGHWESQWRCQAAIATIFGVRSA
jgi:hypothetical protein